MVTDPQGLVCSRDRRGSQLVGRHEPARRREMMRDRGQILRSPPAPQRTGDAGPPRRLGVTHSTVHELTERGMDETHAPVWLWVENARRGRGRDVHRGIATEHLAQKGPRHLPAHERDDPEHLGRFARESLEAPPQNIGGGALEGHR
jgi:hypothetical protein